MINKKVYKQILDLMPICCVDLVLYNKGKILLAKRKNNPAKDQWWVPGGRVLKNEKLTDSVKRKAKDELGVDVNIKKVIGIYEIKFNKGPFKNIKNGIHNISVNFLVELKNEKDCIKLDKTNKMYKFVDRIDSSLHPYVKEVIADSKVLKNQRNNLSKNKFNILNIY